MAAQRNVNYAPVIASEGELTNPLDEALVADTGALPAGQYEVFALVGASAIAQIKMERRNRANSANVGVVVGGLYVPANQTVPIAWTYEIMRDERIRLLLDDAVAAGTVWGSICAKRIGDPSS